MRIINARAPKPSDLLEAAREFEKLPPVCVELRVSVDLFEKLCAACEDPSHADPMPAPMRTLCGCVSGVPVAVLHYLQPGQWLAVFSDGSAELYVRDRLVIVQEGLTR